MRCIGFSTGALAKGDFQLGIELQRLPSLRAIELSALREEELAPLVQDLPSLQLGQFAYRSLHAPSSLRSMSNTQLVDSLQCPAVLGMPIVVHPDIVDDIEPWRALGNRLLLENMDQRKPTCRTAREMRPFFDALSEARFCFDIGHARQVDSTMSVAVEFLTEYRERLAEVHISEVNWQCRHVAISSAAALAFQRVAALIPAEVPIIIESQVAPDRIERELQTVLRCLSPNEPLFDRRDVPTEVAG